MIERVILQNVSVEIPIFGSAHRRLSKSTRLGFSNRLNSRSNSVVVNALSSLNVRLNDGERVGLLGKNGSGKTTLLRLINGVLTPTRGSVSVEGKIASLIDLFLGIDPYATGMENIFMRGMLLGWSRSQIKNSLPDILNFADIGDFVHLPLKTYSSGMSMRLAFAVATALPADILLMDEWLSVGDNQFSCKAQERLNNLVKSTNLVVLASHSEDLIRSFCNRVLVLEEGRIVMDGEPDTVCDFYFRDIR